MEVRKYSKRTDRLRIQPYRHLIQSVFLLLTLWIGITFYLFISQLERGLWPVIARPAGVEAFLPISALISLKYWLMTGIFNTIHPSALVLLLIFLTIAVVLKKGFCSWICPFGWLSEMLAKVHVRIFDRQWTLPKWLDFPLRSLKYLLLLFFIWAVFVEMNRSALEKFIYSPYNRVADIKMLYFFTHMRETTLWTLLLLIGLSLAIPYFWCRYLCPYGALLGALSWLSVFKINRNRESCIDCEKCSKACPAKIPVHKEKTVFSDECHSCLHCIDVCPVRDTLYVSVTNKGRRISRRAFAWAIIGIFVAGTTIARLLGVWDNKITNKEYMHHIENIDDPEYYHNRGDVSDYDKQKWGPKKGAENSEFRERENP